MSEILIVGALELLSENLYLALSEEYRVILAGKKISSKKYDRKIVGYSASPMDDQFSQLFDVYSFKTVFYISGYADEGSGKFGEIQQLERVLTECARAKVEKIVVLTSMDSLNRESVSAARMAETNAAYRNADNYLTSRALLAGQLEELCAYFSGRTGLKTVILHLPYLAAAGNKNNFLGRTFGGVYHGEPVSFPYGAEDRLDFLTEKDLARLLRNITEET